MTNLTLPIVTIAALTDSINPCAFSVLLLTIGFLVSLKKTSRQIISIAGTYILGIYLTYITIGLGVLKALSFFGIPKAISHLGAIAIILVGIINLLENFIPNFPIHLAIPKFIKPQIAKLMNKGTYFAMFSMGIIVGLFEFPCTGGPYLLILSLLHDQSTYLSGALYLIYYNLIFIAPLVGLLLAISHPRLHNKINTWRKTNSSKTDIVASIIMVVLGGIILML
jgi:cytochrome c-type biogenesis protein